MSSILRILIGAAVLGGATLASAQSAPPQREPRPEPETEPQTQPDAPDDTDTTGAAADAPAEDVFTLVDAGAEPRRELRFTPTSGTEQTYVMTMDMTVSQRTPQQAAPPMTLPTTTTTFRSTVNEVSDDAIGFAVDFQDMTVAEAPGVPAQILNGLRQIAQGIAGITGTGTMTPHGRVGELELESGQTVDNPMLAQQTAQQVASIEQALQRLAVRLPQEPVGVGASWQIERRHNVNGADALQVITLTLVELTDAGATIELVGTSTAEPQAMNPPNVPPQVDVRLQEYSGSSEGTVRLRWDQLFPAESELTSSESMTAVLSRGGNEQTAINEGRTTFRLRSVAPGEETTGEAPAPSDESGGAANGTVDDDAGAPAGGDGEAEH